jgi:hypothetical protein
MIVGLPRSFVFAGNDKSATQVHHGFDLQLSTIHFPPSAVLNTLPPFITKFTFSS